MSKRTTTSKVLRAKTRKLNRTNESLAADLKATNVALGKATDKINELEGELSCLLVSYVVHKALTLIKYGGSAMKIADRMAEISAEITTLADEGRKLYELYHHHGYRDTEVTEENVIPFPTKEQRNA